MQAAPPALLPVLAAWCFSEPVEISKNMQLNKRGKHIALSSNSVVYVFCSHRVRTLVSAQMHVAQDDIFRVIKCDLPQICLGSSVVT